MLDTKALLAKFHGVIDDFKTAGSATPEEAAQGKADAQGYLDAVARGDTAAAGNYRVALGGLFGAAEFRATNAAHRAAVRSLWTVLEWLLEAVLAAAV